MEFLSHLKQANLAFLLEKKVNFLVNVWASNMVYNTEKIKSKLKSKSHFYVREDVKEGDKVVIIDDVLATGGTLTAAIKLIEQQGGQVVQILLINRV